jgi:uncharacterized membrane protein YcjF (UPF0283 family)
MNEEITVSTRLRLLPDGLLEVTVIGTAEQLEEVFSDEFSEGLADALGLGE